jgi:hypothetical protein
LSVKQIANGCKFLLGSGFFSPGRFEQLNGAVNLLFQRVEIAGGTFESELTFSHGSHEKPSKTFPTLNCKN